MLDLPDWKSRYRHDPIQPLLESKFEAIRYYASRDLLGEEVEPITLLWDLPEPKALLRRQRDDGSWRYPGKNPERYPDVNYGLLETYKRLRLLVGKYGLDRTHPQIEKAAEYMFSCQSHEGDFRGIYADQYAPHYTGIFSEALIKAGYHDDLRMDRCLEWLLSVRMDDGGWAHSLLTQGLDWSEQTRLTTEKSEPVPFEKSKPFSNNVTGMALRAFACHPVYRHAEEAKSAGGLLATRFFKPNVYSSYRAADNWVRFQYPFWWNNVLMALDSLSLLGFGIDHRKVKEALDWFVEHQCEDGLWENSYKKRAKRIDTERAREGRLWITLAVCSVFKRFHEKRHEIS